MEEFVVANAPQQFAAYFVLIVVLLVPRKSKYFPIRHYQLVLAV